MGKVDHTSHGFGPVRDGHAHSDIARNGAPKHVHGIEVAFRQRTRSSSTDILRGSAKRTHVAQPVIGHRSRVSSDLGDAILRTAFNGSRR